MQRYKSVVLKTRICCIQSQLIPSVSDALDYTEKWLEDTVRCLKEGGVDSSRAASSDPPSLLPLNIHNQAYLRLLRWDHAADPFPEVSTSKSQSLSYAVSHAALLKTLYFFFSNLFSFTLCHLCLWNPHPHIQTAFLLPSPLSSPSRQC